MMGGCCYKLDEREKELKKLERKKFKLECKMEAIQDEMLHLSIIKKDHNGKLNKKRFYRKQHLEKVLEHYNKVINDYIVELNRLKKEQQFDN